MLEMILKMLPKEYAEIAKDISEKLQQGGRFVIVVDLPIVSVYTESGKTYQLTMPEEVKK